MIQPARTEELKRLRSAVDVSTMDLKDQFEGARRCIQPATIARAIDQHPIGALCVAALGGYLMSRVLKIRGLRLIALVTAESVARKAMAAVADAAE